MNQSLKAIFQFMLIVGAVACPLVWFVVDRSEFVDTMRIVLPVLVTWSLFALIWAATRKDQAPDFLSKLSSQFFERDGFCFSVDLQVTDAVCLLCVYFQNRYELPCTAQISFLVAASDSSAFQNLTMNISCGPAEFGRRMSPWAIPKSLQGKIATMSLMTGVEYPEGRGSLLRFREGIRTGAIKESSARNLLILAMALSGHIIIEKPARLQVALPSNLEDPPVPREIVTETIWRLGDPLPAEPSTF